MQDDSLTRIVGAFLAILSFLVLTEGTNIGSSPEGLMRLVAWIVLIKGLMLCWWPDWLVDIQKRFLANTEFMIFGAVLMLIFGFLFIIAGTMV
jgi:hypothetical protein